MAAFQIRYSHWLCTSISCSVYSQITVGNVTLPKAILSTANIFAVHFKALCFWNQLIFLNETFRMASSLSFPKNQAILDGLENCVMPATLIFQKHSFFKKCPKNLTNFGKFQIFFCISCCNFIGLFNCISFVFKLLVV